MRKKIAKTWFESPIETVLGLKACDFTDSKGNTFRVSAHYADFRKEYYAISITPQLTDYHLQQYKIVPQGLWTVYRSVKTGNITCVTIHPRENPALYIRLHPAPDRGKNNKSFIDICLLNVYVSKNTPVNLPLKRLYTMSLSQLRALTPDNIPWDLFEPPLFLNRAEFMSKIIRQRSYSLAELDNGCFDKNGKPIHITDATPQTSSEVIHALRIDQHPAEIIGGVDDAGFAKWVIDGIIKPIAGEGTIVQSLKFPTETPVMHGMAESLKEKSTLFFKLDWIRNLGAAALSLNLNRTVYPAQSGLDVTVTPFALTKDVSGLCLSDTMASSSFLGYEKHAGYKIEYLQALLYYLTIMEPGHFYLGCLNHIVEGETMRKYDSIAVFLPYFDAWGRFHINVFNGKEEIPFETFVMKNSSAHAALIRVRIPENGFFNP